MRFDINFLRQFCIENNLIIDDIGENVVVNRELRINGLCLKCTCPFTKTFRMIVKNGALCEECMKNKASTLIKQSLITFDTTRLDKFCQENDVEANYDKSQTLNQLTIISGPCKTTDCNYFYSKPFRQLIKIGAFCEKCSLDRGKEKIKATTFKNYGVTSSLKSKEIRERIKEETFEKHGFAYLAQTQEFKNKVIATNLLKYGCKSSLQVKEVREKGIETNLKKYGARSHMQNAEFVENLSKYSFKTYVMPSGKELFYQGYENFAFDKLLNDKIDESDIINKRTEVPNIWYVDENNEKRRHYVDIYIPSKNMCIEVKSMWTLQKKEGNVLLKQNAAKQLGYSYEIWIFNNKGELLQCLQ